LHTPSIVQEARQKVIDTLLMLIVGGDCDIIICIVAYSGSRYIDYWFILLPCDLSIQDARPKIMDNVLMVLLR